MEEVILIAKAMLLVAAALFALMIVTIAFYAIIMGIQTAIEERKQKKGKKK